MFRIIPEKVLLDKRVPANAKFIMSDIMSWSLSSLECFNKNEYFALRYDIDPNSVSRHISLLKKLKYIKVKEYYKPGTKFVIKRILIPSKEIMYSLNETENIISEVLLKESAHSEETTQFNTKYSFEQMRKVAGIK